jgi:hypothetical protein
MSSEAQPSCDAGRGRSGIAWRTACVLFIGALVYVLSFGPAVRLTSHLIDGSGGQLREVRKPACPSWGPAVQAIYRPLYFVTSGQAGRLPQRVLLWYITLWG